MNRVRVLSAVALLIAGLLLVGLALALYVAGVGNPPLPVSYWFVPLGATVIGLVLLLAGTGLLLQPEDAGRLVAVAQQSPTRRIMYFPTVPRPLAEGFPRRTCPTCGTEFVGTEPTCPRDGTELPAIPSIPPAAR